MGQLIPRRKPSAFAFLVWIAIISLIYIHTSLIQIVTPANAKVESFKKLEIQFPFVKMPIPSNNVVKTDLICMAENIYYEAATESYLGKLAVGMVVMNRIKSDKYPKSVCGVIYENSQFSWTSQVNRSIVKTSPGWLQSVAVAKEVLEKKDTLTDIIEGATSYHADYVKPDWSKKLQYVTKIEHHIFYKLPKS